MPPPESNYRHVILRIKTITEGRGSQIHFETPSALVSESFIQEIITEWPFPPRHEQSKGTGRQSLLGW